MQLDTDIRYIKGIGEARARSLEKLGIRDLAGLVSYFPRAYEDRSSFKPIAALEDGESVCVRAMVAEEPQLVRIRGGMEMVKLRAVDETGTLFINFFNRAYVRSQLHRGQSLVFFGRVSVQNGLRSMANPLFEPEGASNATGRIMPVYRLTAGLSQKVLIHCVRSALTACAGCLPDYLPGDTALDHGLCTARYAYENIHFPKDFRALELARRRLVFEELFVLVCALGLLRGGRGKVRGAKLRRAELSDFTSTLPFTPTGAQLRAIGEAVEDMCSGRLMNRLVQGDVGSGKTLVAAACIWYAAQSGAQSAFMAPTEILAEQHYATLTGFLEPFGIRVAKLTGSMKAKEKREVLAALASGEAQLCVGTHALLSEGVEFHDLALVVTDEQHRFGVQQRAALAEKGAVPPHILVMSATPIPRTLALIIYGDLDVSLIDELPPGRQKVDTFAVDSSYRARLNGFMEKLVSEGRQVFVVCPRIEDDEEQPDDLKSAEEHAAELREQLPGLRIGCIHGKLKAKEKDELMSQFSSGGLDVLVSTTVIEVGVDVPNAALMVIENAERFGLSQLHQLRGRVGRGRHKSWCILVSDAKGEEARARLAAMTHISDGFKIAEEDLRLRGPGDFFGSRQHGLPELHIADLGADMNVLKAAQESAKKLLESDPELAYPENARLKERAEELISLSGGRFN